MASRIISVPQPYRGKKGPDGRPLCCWCGGPIPARAVRWCGDECVARYQIARGDQGAARRWLSRNQHGKPTPPMPCDVCGIDMSGDAILSRVLAAAPGDRVKQYWLRRNQERWEADHRVPLAEGGERTPENLRVLCRPCHVSETAKLRARLAARRNGES